MKFGINVQNMFAGYWYMQIMDFLNAKLSHDHFATAENWKGQTFMKEVNSDPVRKM